MDITSISGESAYQQQKVANNVQTSVEAKVNESQRTQGAAVIKLLEASTIQPTADGSVDIRA